MAKQILTELANNDFVYHQHQCLVNIIYSVSASFTQILNLTNNKNNPDQIKHTCSHIILNTSLKFFYKITNIGEVRFQ